MQAYLQMIADGSVKLDKIIHSIFPVEQATAAYQSLVTNQEQPLLVLLSYSPIVEPPSKPQPKLTKSWIPPTKGIIKTALVGTGSFIQAMHIPNLKLLSNKFAIRAVCDQNGIAARKAAQSFQDSTILIETNYQRILESDVDLIIIGTRHNSHADLAIKALEAGKAVFVEKPMAISHGEFEQLREALSKTTAPFMVGYNRRFAPAVEKIRGITDSRINPLIIQYTMNGGYVPYDSWVQTDEGGGRIIGEACHIFDLFRSLTGSAAVSVSVDGIEPRTGSVHSSDNTVVTIKYKDGSLCSMLYTGIGNKSAAKERMQVFCDEQVFVLDDYLSLTAFGVDCKWSSNKVDKGHLSELDVFSNEVLSGNRFPIPLDELEEAWLISRQVADKLSN